MPRINDELLDSVIYLYPSYESAKSGESYGGSGFLVGVNSEKDPSRVYIYAITNSHVITEGKSTFLRINTHKDDTEIVQSRDLNDWVHHPDGDDIAIAGLAGNFDSLKIKCISPKMFITKDIIKKHNIGPGDETFMCGRFIQYDGKQKNVPSVRFGNISMMPYEGVRHPRGYDQESFLVEARSLSGYSGSPVFTYLNHATIRPGETTLPIVREETGPWLLGIDWAHIPIYERVKEADKVTNVSQGYMVTLNTGMMAVVPAWKIQDLISLDHFVEQRARADEFF